MQNEVQDHVELFQAFDRKEIESAVADRAGFLSWCNCYSPLD